MLPLLVRHRCSQWCLDEGVAEVPDCGFRRWAPPCHPLSYLLVIWDTGAAPEPGALWAGHGQGWWSCGSTFGVGNISMASCPGQPSAPPSPPAHWRGATAASLGSTSRVRCLELAGPITQLPRCCGDVDHWVSCKNSYLLNAELLNSVNTRGGKASALTSARSPAGRGWHRRKVLGEQPQARAGAQRRALPSKAAASGTELAHGRAKGFLPGGLVSSPSNAKSCCQERSTGVGETL